MVLTSGASTNTGAQTNTPESMHTDFASCNSLMSISGCLDDEVNNKIYFPELYFY
jgi:hypothetical protein